MSIAFYTAYLCMSDCSTVGGGKSMKNYIHRKFYIHCFRLFSSIQSGRWMLGALKVTNIHKKRHVKIVFLMLLVRSLDVYLRSTSSTWQFKTLTAIQAKAWAQNNLRDKREKSKLISKMRISHDFWHYNFDEGRWVPRGQRRSTTVPKSRVARQLKTLYCSVEAKISNRYDDKSDRRKTSNTFG